MLSIMTLPLKTSFCLIFILINVSLSQTSSEYYVSLRAGLSVNDYGTDFKHYEGDFGYIYPSRFNLTKNVYIETGLNFTTGLMNRGSKNGITLSGGPRIYLNILRRKVVFLLSSMPTYVSRDFYRDFSIGGKFHFLSQAGIFITLHENYGLEYLFQHLSNAGLDKPNPGLNFHMIGIRIHQ